MTTQDPQSSPGMCARPVVMVIGSALDGASMPSVDSADGGSRFVSA
ncbi:MAG: hypothetical protein ABIQ53_08105 [Terracoccus sp.]